MNEESNLDWSLDEEIDKYEEEIKRSWEKPVFDHLFCERPYFSAPALRYF